MFTFKSDSDASAYAAVVLSVPDPAGKREVIVSCRGAVALYAMLAELLDPDYAQRIIEDQDLLQGICTRADSL